MGDMVGGAGEGDQKNIYAFGKNLGLAFQVQDDWLDSFGDPSTFGKQRGGDILANKKTFLLVQALEKASAEQKQSIQDLLQHPVPDKIERMMELFRATGVDKAAQKAKQAYMATAYFHLGSINVPDKNKAPLRELADYLMERKI
jgi:geranylgeranyl diphosphate synthase type II